MVEANSLPYVNGVRAYNVGPITCVKIYYVDDLYVPSRHVKGTIYLDSIHQLKHYNILNKEYYRILK